MGEETTKIMVIGHDGRFGLFILKGSWTLINTRAAGNGCIAS